MVTVPLIELVETTSSVGFDNLIASLAEVGGRDPAHGEVYRVVLALFLLTFLGQFLCVHYLAVCVVRGCLWRSGWAWIVIPLRANRLFH
jgi:hypothetical protein